MNEHLTTEQLYELIDGALPEDQRKELESHITGCASCAAELALLGRIEGAARSLPLAQPSGEFTAMVMARIQAQPPVAATTPASRAGLLPGLLKRWGLRIAAAVALVALYVWFLRRDDAAPPATGRDISAMNVLGMIVDAIGNGITALVPHLTGRSGGYLLMASIVIALLMMADEMMKGRSYRSRS